jgi:hypothetical protein
MMNRVRAIAALFPRYGLAVSWLLSVVWMGYDYLRDPGNTALHGYNRPGTFELTIKLGLVELFILYFILNPWVRKWKIARVLLAIVLSWVWTIVFALMTIHAGGIAMIHLFWLLMVDVVLFIALFFIYEKQNQ